MRYSRTSTPQSRANAVLARGYHPDSRVDSGRIQASQNRRGSDEIAAVPISARTLLRAPDGAGPQPPDAAATVVTFLLRGAHPGGTTAKEMS
ncbi:hypothetical protein Acy02nite_19440 [Actinoplanes cyaneus]|uniref:Uncharacterized protein n=1 Tax=Actinoplanes cyaneus TaxID=52696 RepID=A0A919IIH4_9ACTN|nr:hypothetical protein Acy02nite_19440 [Actinoplanes cyaneus]